MLKKRVFGGLRSAVRRGFGYGAPALSALLVMACAEESGGEQSPPAPVQEAGAADALPFGAQGAANDAGAQGSSGPATSGAHVGQEPNTQLDRDASFDWPQTQPGAQRRCQGGTYGGTWTCTSFGFIPFGGKVDLNFVESMDGEFLELVNAKIEGKVDITGHFFRAELVGKLDCMTLKLSAEAKGGKYGNYDAARDAIVSQVGTFNGTLTGSLDPETRQLKGEWSLLADGTIDCVGPWDASFTP